MKTKIQTQTDVIIGGGLSGLITGYYNPTAKIIVDKPMGQQQGIALGPRILQYDVGLFLMLKEIFGSRIGFSKINIGFEESSVITETPRPGFIEDYSFLTRGTREVQPSFMSGGQTEISIITIDKDSKNSFQIFTQELYDIAKKRNQIIIGRVESIDQEKKILKTKTKIYGYDKLYSTIPLNIYNNIIDQPIFNQDIFKLKNKNYIITEYNNKDDIKAKDDFMYCYSLNSYTRKTYMEDYIVFEVSYEVYMDQPKELNGNKVKESMSIPLQIIDNIGLDSYKNTEFVGRLAKWHHGILIGDVVEQIRKKI